MNDSTATSATSSAADTPPHHADAKPARMEGEGRKSSGLPPRSRAREFALQALYQYTVGGNDTASVDTFTRGLSGFNKCDDVYFDTLLRGCTGMAGDLDELIVPFLDRDLSQISPVERMVMWIAAFELKTQAEIPWKVVINEAVELAKSFGGSDGYKYVNGVLNHLAKQLRPHEPA